MRMVFLAVTVAMAGAAWGLTGEAVRAVAVLVVATPCPLILAVPVALVAGLSRAAGRGILVKGGKALETLARIRVLVLDKTGTLTSGRAKLVEIRVAAALIRDRAVPPRGLAGSGVEARRSPRRWWRRPKPAASKLSMPSAVVETPGEGVEGVVDGRHVIVGGRAFVRARLARPCATATTSAAGEVAVAVAVDGEMAGELILADALREGAAPLMGALRRAGIERIVLATGDRRDVALAVTAGLGLDAIRAELTPDQKIMVVLSERKFGPVMMVGDGVNDAPALAAADVGMAMGARGSAASAETADVVLLVDQIDRVVPALLIARRSRRIALQSVVAGIGLSLAGMIAAAFGLITPVQGALLQEAIDVAVMLNALRALGGSDAG